MRLAVVLLAPLVVACAGAPKVKVATTEVDDPPRAEPPRSPDIAAARELDQQGVRSYVEGRYTDAVHLFRDAFRAGGPPSELWNIARSKEKLDDPEGAAGAIEEYLSQSSLVPSDRAEAERELRALQSRNSLLVVATEPEGATVTIDGKTSGTTPASLEIRPGSHTLSVHRDGFADEARTLDARFGRAMFVSLDLRPAGK
jgi:hypothetical protein